MSFPLFHRPGTVVFLDDDPDYLEMLALVLPRHWHVQAVPAARRMHQLPAAGAAVLGGGCLEPAAADRPVARRQAADPADPGLLVQVHGTLCADARVRGRLFHAGHGRPAGARRAGRLAGLAGAADGAGRRTGRGARLQPRSDRPVHRQADAGHLAPPDRGGGAPAGHAERPPCADLAGHAQARAERAAARCPRVGRDLAQLRREATGSSTS